MQLEEFISRRKIVLSEEVASLCKKGIDLMGASLDPNHNEEHLFGIFSDLDRFLDEEPQVKDTDLDFEILLLAICWHDVWRSRRPQTASRIVVILERLWEAKGSVRIFKKMAREVSLSKKLTDPVSYAIGKHAGWQLLPLDTCEARILWDMDHLEEWSLPRLEKLEERYLVPGKVDSRMLRLAKFYLDHFLLRQTGNLYYFPWSKAKFQKRKKLYLLKVDKLLQQHQDKWQS